MPVSSSYFTSLSAVSTKELDNYYLTFHASKGFNLERKRYSFGLLSAPITAIIHMWRVFTGYSFAFEYNVSQLVELLKNKNISLADTKCCLKAAKRLSAMADTVLVKKDKKPDELKVLLGDTSKAFLAQQLGESGNKPLEFYCQANLFKQAMQLVAKGDDISSLSGYAKDVLLEYFLGKKEFALAEKMLASGGDSRELDLNPKQLENLDTHLGLHGSHFKDFFIYKKNSSVLFKRCKDDILDMRNALTQTQEMLIDSNLQNILKHNINKILYVIDENWLQLRDPTLLVNRLGSTQCIVSSYGYNELAETIKACKLRLISSVAHVNEVHPVTYAFDRNLSIELKELICFGADLGDLSKESKNKIFKNRLSKNDFESALKLYEAGADMFECPNLPKFYAYINANKTADELTAMMNRGMRLASSMYTVDESHFRDKVFITIPDAIEATCPIEQLRDLFKGLNFTNPAGQFYLDPKNICDYEGTVKQHIKHIKEKGLNRFIKHVRENIAFLGTPEKDSEVLSLFYNLIERAVTHTIRKIKDMPEGDDKQYMIRNVMTEYLRGSFLCGGKFYAMACQQYIAVTKGRAATFAEEVYDVLTKYREVLFQSLVPYSAHNVHVFNNMMRALGKEFGIPGAEMMGDFEDIFEHIGFNPTEKRAQFTELYTADNILFESIKLSIEQTGELREGLYDWYKANLPDSWRKEHYKAISDKVATLESIAEQKAYLVQNDIYPEPGQSVQEAISTARVISYKESEIIEDMQAVETKIKPSAVAYMLCKIGVLKQLCKS